MQHTDITSSDELLDKVKPNLNLFGALVLDWIEERVDRTDVFTVDKSNTLRRCMELKERLSQPSSFYNAISYSTIFSTGSGNSILSLPRPQKQIIAEEDSIA
jgi:hypothetical protein